MTQTEMNAIFISTLEGIKSVCEKTTSGNVSHNIAAIKCKCTDMLQFFDRWNKHIPSATDDVLSRIPELQWNAETKTMERIRRRAKKGEDYLMVGARGGLLEFTENNDDFDNKVFNSGNYYLLEELEQAEEDAKAIKAIFEKRLKV